MSATIDRLVMPKWGMSMTEGKLVQWLVEKGTVLTVGDEVAEVETEKINGVVEAQSDGTLRRQVVGAGETVPVGALIGIVADGDVSEDEVQAVITEFKVPSPGEGEPEAAGAEPEFVELSGRRLRYLRQGEGDEIVVLVHGFGGDLEGWLFSQDAFAAEHTVYAVDLPGHGESSKAVGEGSLSDLASALEEFLDLHGHPRVHLVGHSLGGAVSASVALARPERIASLTLLGSAGLGPEINDEYVEGFVHASTRRELKPILELLFADPGLVTRKLVDEVLRNRRLDGAQDALSAIASRLFPGGHQTIDLSAGLAGLGLPLLVIWGERDRIIPAEHAANAPQTATVKVIPSAGHSPHIEAAREVNRLIGEHIQAAAAVRG